jgi:hypothetical protein
MYEQPHIIPIKESGDVYRLEHDYIIDLRPYTTKHVELVIEKGFVYDGASVPRWLWSLSGLGIDGLHRAAALVHDFIYIYKGDFKDDDTGSDITLSRKEADLIFKKMLTDVGIASHRVWLAYHGVRWFGQSVWDD